MKQQKDSDEPLQAARTILKMLPYLRIKYSDW